GSAFGGLSPTTRTHAGITVAAGRSSRMSGGDKILADVNGRPLLAWTLEAFRACRNIERIVVVASPENHEEVADITAAIPRVSAVVIGGDRRRDSVKAGLDALEGVDLVVVHDRSRPMVAVDVIASALAGALQTGAGICAIPVGDTVKRASENGLVASTVPRGRLWLAQTPQAFQYRLLEMAHREVEGDMTDDAAMIEN